MHPMESSMFLQSSFVKFLLATLLYSFMNLNTYAEDLIAIKSGGKAIHWTTEKSPHLALNIIDGKADTFWVSSGNTFPHVLAFSMPSNKRFEALSFKAENSNGQGTWAHHIRISSADPFPHMGGWEVIEDIKLPKTGQEKIIAIDGKRGRYFRLEIFSTQDEAASEASFGEFKVIDIYTR